MRKMLSFFLLLVLSSCSFHFPWQANTPEASPTSQPSATDIFTTVVPTSFPTPDLNKSPLVWFGPLPPMQQDTGRPFIGAEDFNEIFELDSPWATTARKIGVVSIYAEWVGVVTDDRLQKVINFVNQNGLALDMGDGPIAYPTDCGSGIESAGGPDNVKKLAAKIKRLGGTLTYISMDEPYYQYSIDGRPGACKWSGEKVAGLIDDYIQAARTVFPDVKVGDIEVLHPGMDPAVYMNWLTTFEAVNGYKLPFLHMDVDYSAEDWAQRLKLLDDFSEQQGIDFGIIYFGNWDDLTDEAWLSNTGERVKQYEATAGKQPTHIIFQSWHNRPDFSIPESDPYTYTGFIKTFFDDPSSIGFRSEGAGADIAYRKAVTASKSGPDSSPQNAVDGNPGKCWTAGDFAPQWLEIDLGKEYIVTEIRVRLGQTPAGRSVNTLYFKGGESSSDFSAVTTFDGETDNLSSLIYTFPTPQEGVQYVKVKTTTSPSWISYCEIEVIAAQ